MLKLFIITQLSERASGTCITFVKLSTGTPRSKSTEINVSLFNVPQRVRQNGGCKICSPSPVTFFAPTPRSPFNPRSGKLGTYSYKRPPSCSSSTSTSALVPATTGSLFIKLNFLRHGVGGVPVYVCAQSAVM